MKNYFLSLWIKISELLKNIKIFLYRYKISRVILSYIIYFITILILSIKEWSKIKISRLSAALAYYTSLSLAPLSILIILIASKIFGNISVQNDLYIYIQKILGTQFADVLNNLIHNALKSSGKYTATILGICAIIFGSSNGVRYLKDALNTIWGIKKTEKKGIFYFVKDSLISIGITMIIVLITNVFLFTSPFISVIETNVSHYIPYFNQVKLLFTTGISYLIIIVFFMLVYKVLPDHALQWREIFPGALFATFLFKLGDLFIRIYLERTFITSIFGAAGSLVVILLWLYYIAHIIFFGAQFTHIWTLNKDMLAEI